MSEARETRIAVLGLGIMGMAVARNLLAAGFSVSGWNRGAARAREFESAGGTCADTPARAVGGADFVITLLSDGNAIEQVMAGEHGALRAIPRQAIWLQMSTIGVTAIARCSALAAAAGIAIVDAPVLGTRQPAEEGRLTVLASGNSLLRERCAVVFAPLSERVLWVGDVGAGSRLKLVANQWSTGMVAVLAETVTLARRLAVDPAAFLGLIDGGTFDCPYAQIKGKLLLARDFRPSFPLDMAHKDVRLALDAGLQAGQHLPVTRAIREQYSAAENLGHGREDLCAIIAALDRHWLSDQADAPLWATTS